MSLRGVGACLMLAVVLAACDGQGDENGDVAVEVVTAVVREVVAGLPAGEDPDARPVLYVLSIGEDGISAAVQADVVETLVDDVDVRFADERSETLDGGEPGEPVHDGGVLVAVGDIPDSGGEVDVVVEIYRDADDQSRVVYSFAREASEWRVTSTSVLPLE